MWSNPECWFAQPKAQAEVEAEPPKAAPPSELDTMISEMEGRIMARRVLLRACRAPHFSVRYLDPGSGRNIPAIWHGFGAYSGVFIPET